jgi:cell division protein FtsW
MGECAEMTTNAITRTKKKTHSLNLGVDVPLLICTSALLAIGLLFVYSSSWEFALQLGQSPSYFLTRQMLFAGVGISIAIIAFFFDYHRIHRLVIPMVVVTLILLLLVGVGLGESLLGARRSLFQGSIQPSEFTKLVIIIYLTFWLGSKQEFLNSITLGLLPLMIILGVFCGLVLLQPDLSATITIFILGGIMFFLGGADLNQIVKVLVVALIAGLIVVFISSTGRARVAEFLIGLKDPAQGSYHVIRSIEGIIKGGLFGVGIGKSTVKFTGLPFAPTDSIFAIIAEEVGLLGATVVIVLYVVLLWRGITIANRAPDLTGKLLASGIAIWIFVEAAINISVMVNLMPFAGNALPLISYGGSSIVTILFGIGIIMGVSRVTYKQKDELEGRPLNAVVSLRRDDGWRSVSRSRRPAGIRQ